MDLTIRDARATDLDSILTLNQSEVPHVGSIDTGKLGWYHEQADYFRVVTIDAATAGYLVGFREGSEYSSPNYRWFCERYDEFAYVDRVAVATAARRNGIASALYDDFAATLPASTRIMTCEVNIRPSNPSSMRFHDRLGFRQVGTLTAADGAKEVAMLLRDL